MRSSLKTDPCQSRVVTSISRAICHNSICLRILTRQVLLFEEPQMMRHVNCTRTVYFRSSHGMHSSLSFPSDASSVRRAHSLCTTRWRRSSAHCRFWLFLLLPWRILMPPKLSVLSASFPAPILPLFGCVARLDRQ